MTVEGAAILIAVAASIATAANIICAAVIAKAIRGSNLVISVDSPFGESTHKKPGACAGVDSACSSDDCPTGKTAPSASDEPDTWSNIVSVKPRWKSLAHSCSNLADGNGLTVREQDVCLLLARGYSQQGIADTLCISPSTVKSHCYSIYRKLGIHSQQKLIELVELTDDELGRAAR